MPKPLKRTWDVAYFPHFGLRATEVIHRYVIASPQFLIQIFLMLHKLNLLGDASKAHPINKIPSPLPKRGRVKSETFHGNRSYQSS